MRSMCDAAQETYARQPALSHFNVRLGKLPKGQVTSAAVALEILKEIKQVAIQADQISYNSAIAACGAVWWHSLQLMYSMPQLQLRLDVRSFAISKSMPWTTSVQLLRTMEQAIIAPNQITFSSMLPLLPSFNWPLALDLCSFSQWYWISMDRVSFDAAIRSCSRWQRSSSLLLSMQAQKIRATCLTYNTILNCLKNRWQGSLMLLEAMPSLGILPDTVSYSLGSDQWPWASALLQAMPSRSLRIDLLGLRQAVLSESWRPALDLLEATGSQSFEGTSSHLSLSSLATYTSALLWREALTVSTTQVLGFNFLLKSQDWQRAQHLLLRMECSQVQANTISFNTFLGTTTWQQTLIWLANHLYLGHRNHGSILDLVTFSTSISSCADDEQWTWALYLLHCASECDLRLNVVVYNAAMACSPWRHSIQLLESMWQEGVVPDVVSLNTALSSVRWPSAIHLLSLRLGWRCDSLSLTMSSLTLSRSSSWRESLELHGQYHAAMKAYEDRDWRKALQLCPKDTEASFNTGISACEKGGAWRNALLLLKMMSHVQMVPDVVGLSSAIASQQRHWPVALQLLKVMLTTQVLPNTISYNSAIASAGQSLAWLHALSFFHTMLWNRMHNLISSNSALVVCEEGSRWSLATLLLNDDLPRLALQLLT